MKHLTRFRDANPVYAYRVAQGLTPNAFAEIVGIPESLLAQAEGGTIKTLPPELIAFMNAHGSYDPQKEYDTWFRSIPPHFCCGYYSDPITP